MSLLLSGLLTVQVFAADPATTAIDQAQALAVKKNRQEATAVLRQALEAPSPKARAKLTEALAHISTVFFTDKGQRLFEAGQSAMFETPDLALGQLRDALALEDDNVAILDTTARVQIAKLDCGGALTTLRRARDLNPYAAEPAVLELRALVCLKNFEVFREKLKQLPPLEKSTEPFVQYLVGQDFMQQQSWKRANEVLSKVTADEPRFAEAYYLLYKTSAALESDGENYARKYVSLCKAVSPRERKKFALEPRLCANAKEVEDELAKKNTDI